MSDAEDKAVTYELEGEHLKFVQVNVHHPGTTSGDDQNMDTTCDEADPIPSISYENVEENNARKSFTGGFVKKDKRERRTSLLWTKFTVVDEKERIAACNICHHRFSMSTSNNLKKHLERKHGYSMKLGVFTKNPTQNKYRYVPPSPRPQVSNVKDMTSEAIMLKVVGEDGEEEHIQLIDGQYVSEEVVQNEAQEHDYSAVEHRKSAKQGGYVPARSSFLSNMDEKTKRRKIQELQIECLENKKYNMRLEALLMERQMNLPRSIFTEPLRFTDSQTRGTQTDVGGSDTRVFYVTDKRGGRPIQQLFAVDDDF